MKQLILLSALLLLPACSASSSFVKPDVTVVDFALENATLFETLALMEVRIDNENPYDLEIEGAVHRLYINDTYLGKGFSKEGLQIPRLSSAKHSVKVHISNLSLITNMQSLIQNDQVTFRIDSRIYRKGSFAGTIKVSQTGKFNFIGIEKLNSGAVVHRFQPILAEVL